MENADKHIQSWMREAVGMDLPKSMQLTVVSVQFYTSMKLALTSFHETVRFLRTDLEGFCVVRGGIKLYNCQQAEKASNGSKCKSLQLLA
eukprot:1158006-Pelagomonas_calceolata.AAC.22